MAIQDRDAVIRNLQRAGQAATEEAIGIWMRYGESVDAMEGELFRGEIYQSTVDGLHNQGKDISQYTNPATGEQLAGFVDPQTGQVSANLSSWRAGSRAIYGNIPGVQRVTLADGRSVPIYSKDAIGESVFTDIYDGDIALVPTGTRLGNDVEVVETRDGFDIVTRVKDKKWYQEDWALVAGGMLAALATGGLAAPAVAAAVGTIGATGIAAGVATGAVTGALAGAVGSGVSAELAGGDFLEGAEEGALTGAISGGVSGGLGASTLTKTQRAIAAGTAAAGTAELLDFGDPLRAGLFAAGGVATEGRPVAKGALYGAETAIAGGDLAEVAASVLAGGYAGSVEARVGAGDVTLPPDDAEVVAIEDVEGGVREQVELADMLAVEENVARATSISSAMSNIHRGIVQIAKIDQAREEARRPGDGGDTAPVEMQIVAAPTAATVPAINRSIVANSTVHGGGGHVSRRGKNIFGEGEEDNG